MTQQAVEDVIDDTDWSDEDRDMYYRVLPLALAELDELNASMRQSMEAERDLIDKLAHWTAELNAAAARLRAVLP